MYRRLAVAFSIPLTVFAAVALLAQRPDAFTSSRDHAAIQYSTRAVDTSATRLNRGLETGAVSLTFDKNAGYLPAILSALGVPVESQLLVFSETSAQAPLIKPANPRAIYFNDTTAVGWVRGADTLEVAAHDARQGTIFYALEQQAAARPQLKRRDGCLECHLTWDTLGVPGLTMISTFPMSDDKHAYASGVTVDHRTDFDLRWGGWYVTGKSVPARHYGNAPVIRPAAELNRAAGPAPILSSVTGQFDTAGFLSPYSDVVASMVLAHQTHMTNLLTRLGWEARVAEQSGADPKLVLRMQTAVRDFVDYLLFADEAPFPRRIEGVSGFAEAFAKLGPKDQQGRSLRDLDLTRRLLKYPCSYLIYSPAFDALPASTLDAVYRRMWMVLSGEDGAKRYASLTLADRTAVVDILRETKKNLPAYFATVTK